MTYHVRRTDREITDRERVEELLREGRFCTIALADEGGPYAVTLSYGYAADAGRLYFHCSAEGRKLDAIEAEPRACASVVFDRGYVSGSCEHPYQSVVLTGRMRVVDDPAEKIEALRVLCAHQERSADAFDAMGYNTPGRVKGVTALAFDIESVSAKEGK